MSVKKQIECNSCVFYIPLKCGCAILKDNANDKKGFCKFYKSQSEYKMQYNKDVGGLIPVKND